MSFAAPAAFLAALCALPIIVFYILKVRMRRLPTSTTLFWNQIYDERPPRSIWEVLKHLLSLFAQLLLLALLMFALADPVLKGQFGKARRIVLVIDPSASMNTSEAEGSRFQQAIDEALRISNGLRFRDEMSIVLAGEHPQVVCGMTGHIPTLRRTLNSLNTKEIPTRLEPAIELGKRLLAGNEKGEVIVLTDGCTDEVEAFATDTQLTWKLFGEEVSNVGITSFQARRSLIDPLGYELMVSVRNASEFPVQLRLEIELDELPVDILPLKLDPDQTFVKTIQKTSMKGGELVGRLTEIEFQGESSSLNGDGLELDNQAVAILSERKPQKVLLVSPNKNLFLRKVFEANPLVELETLTELPETWPGDTMIVLHQVVPETLPEANLWLIDPLTNCDAFTVAGEVENSIVTKLDKTSSLMTHVRLDNATMPKATRLELSLPANVLAESVSGDPLYLELKRPEAKLLVLAVSLDEGDLAFRTAFPIMATNSLAWFSGRSGELLPSYSTGKAIDLELPEIANWTKQFGSVENSILLRAPDGSERALSIEMPEANAEKSREVKANSVSNPPPASASANENELNSKEESNLRSSTNDEWRATTDTLDLAGFWSIEAKTIGDDSKATTNVDDESSLVTIACNLSNVRESDLRRSESFPEDIVESVNRTSRWSLPIWFYLAFSAVILMTIEWSLYQRRKIR